MITLNNSLNNVLFWRDEKLKERKKFETKATHDTTLNFNSRL
jgi:hypothetical protein